MFDLATVNPVKKKWGVFKSAKVAGIPCIKDANITRFESMNIRIAHYFKIHNFMVTELLI